MKKLSIIARRPLLWSLYMFLALELTWVFIYFGEYSENFANAPFRYALSWVAKFSIFYIIALLYQYYTKASNADQQ